MKLKPATPQEAYSYRVMHGISIEQMAFLMDMSTSAYQRWEYQRKPSEAKHLNFHQTQGCSNLILRGDQMAKQESAAAYNV